MKCKTVALRRSMGGGSASNLLCLPDTYFLNDALQDGELVMIACCKCGERYHKKCMDV